MATPLAIEYVHADAAATDELSDAAFDAVVCNFGLSDIDDLDDGRFGSKVRCNARVLAPVEFE